MPGHSPEDVPVPAGNEESRANKKPSRRRWIFLAVFVVAVVLIFALSARKSAFPPLPEPNGYDALVRAAAKVVQTQSWKVMTTNELAGFVMTNQAALIELRRALELPSAVPVKMDMDWIANQMTNVINLKEAAIAMEAEIRYRQSQGDLLGALNESLDLLRFGQAIARHGVWLNTLLGTTCEVMGVRRMTNLLSSLTAEQSKHAIDQLVRYELQRESFDQITDREKEWQRKTHNLFVRLRETFNEYILHRESFGRLFVPDMEKEYHDRILEVRRLILALASRAFELERGRKPQRASELVPAYLQTRPIDPTSGSALELP